jgi:hypothetical protein
MIINTDSTLYIMELYVLYFLFTLILIATFIYVITVNKDHHLTYIIVSGCMATLFAGITYWNYRDTLNN